MGPMAVVMCDEHVHHMVEMFAIEDQEPIQTFRANCPHEPLRGAVRLRRTKGRANDLYPFGLKNPVKTLCEFWIPIANQETEPFRAVLRQYSDHRANRHGDAHSAIRAQTFQAALTKIARVGLRPVV